MYRLIIVDDEAMIRKGLHRIISWAELGFEVAGVLSNSEDALNALKGGGIDVLLSDIQMPNKTGLELAVEAKQIDPNIRIVIISGYDRFDYAVSALKIQVDDYILKPLNPDIIKATFKKLKEKLDEQWALESVQIQQRQVETEYDMLRLLNQELMDSENFRKHIGNSAFIRLVFLYMPALSGRDLMLAIEDLNSLTRFYLHLSDKALHAVFLPSDEATRFVEDLRLLLDGYGCDTFKIVKSKEFYHTADAYQIYLAASEELWRNTSEQIIDMDCNSVQNDHCIVLLKKKFAVILEEGSDVLLESELDDLFMLVCKHRLPAGIILCSNLLRDMLRMFHVQDSGDFILLNSDTPPPNDCAELKRMMHDDFKLLLKTLRQQAESPVAVLVARAKRLIEKQCADPNFSLSALARQLNLSYNYLSTVFSKEAGISLLSYMTSVRMEKARSIILQRKYKINAIATMVGYNNPRYFSDAFRNYFQKSPKDYLLNVGKGPEIVKENETMNDCQSGEHADET